MISSELARIIGRYALFADNMIRIAQIGRSLHRIAERWCCEEMTDETTARLERREAKLESEAWGLAVAMGCTVYFQGDPRGVSIYLFPSAWGGTMETFQHKHRSDYNRDGIPIPLR